MKPWSRAHDLGCTDEFRVDPSSIPLDRPKDRSPGMTRPFRFGVVAPLRTDLPTWRDRVRRPHRRRRLLDAADARCPAMATGAWPHAGPRRGPCQHPRGYLGICVSGTPALDHRVGSALAIGTH